MFGQLQQREWHSRMVIDVDVLSDLSVLNCALNGGDIDVRGVCAELDGIPAETLDLRLQPTTLQKKLDDGKKLAFRVLARDTAVPVDTEMPKCVIWAVLTS